MSHSHHPEQHSAHNQATEQQPDERHTDLNDRQVKLVTFGCRLNTYESEVIKNLTESAGLSNTIIVNTCAVTAEAERQARQSIRKMKRDNPDLKIIVTGCSAQINPQQYAEMPEIDAVVGNDDKMKIETYQQLNGKDHAKVFVNDIMSVKETASHLVSGFEGKTRAFVQVQNGCNHRCTFCIIPYGRGNSRSVPVGEIVKQVQHLVDKGYQEVVLTGVDITSYGEDLPGTPKLGEMMTRLLRLVPDLPRLRLSSVDPSEIDEPLWNLIKDEPRLMPHLHLSLQAGDDMVLKRMKRRHLRQDAIDFCKKARELRPDVVFGADIIAGFPTETDEMFENTHRIVDECDLTYLHVFPYSPRPGTPAARMPQVNGTDIKKRAATLRQAGELAEQKLYNSYVGKTVRVLIETNSDGVIRGKTDHFIPVQVKITSLSSSDLSIIYVNIINNCITHLEGTLL